MCWVEPGGQDGPVFSYESHQRDIGLWIEYGQLLYQIDLRRRSFVGQAKILSFQIFRTGKWVHVATSYDHNTGDYTLYINGHLRDSRHIDTGYLTTNDAQRIRMGSTLYGRDHFKGKIAKMKVFNVALNEAQIQTSIRSGSSTFSVIVVSASPIIPLIIETPVIGKPRKIYQTHISRYNFAKQRLLRREKKSGINRFGECTESLHVRPNAKSDTHYPLSKAVKSNFLVTC